MATNFCLTIEPYCFIAIKESRAIIYNTLSKNKLITEDPEIINILTQINIPENGRSVLLNKTKVNDEKINFFITEIQNNFMGDIHILLARFQKPFQLVPKIFFEKDFDKIKQNQELDYYFSFDIPNLLKELFIYVTNECSEDCIDCQHTFKQISFCGKFETNVKEIKFEFLFKILNEAYSLHSIDINILGGNIFKYSSFPQLVSLLKRNPRKTIFHIHYLNLLYLQNAEINLTNINRLEFTILVNFPVNRIKFKDVVNILNLHSFNYKLVFAIKSEADFKEAEYIIQTYSFDKYEYTPFFNGENLSFLHKNVYLDHDDIKAISIEMKEILANTKINSVDYGKLIIVPDKLVHANLYFKPIGILFKKNLMELVKQEIFNGQAWLRIRNFQPCSECVYQYLCPPPTNIELAIGENKICNIN